MPLIGQILVTLDLGQLHLELSRPIDWCTTDQLLLLVQLSLGDTLAEAATLLIGDDAADLSFRTLQYTMIITGIIDWVRLGA